MVSRDFPLFSGPGLYTPAPFSPADFPVTGPPPCESGKTHSPPGAILRAAGRMGALRIDRLGRLP